MHVDFQNFMLSPFHLKPNCTAHDFAVTCVGIKLDRWIEKGRTFSDLTRNSILSQYLVGGS